MSIHVACLWMCVLFYLSFVCLLVCVYASEFEVHWGSAFEPGTSRLPYYCTPPVCVPAVLGALAVWWRNNKKTKQTETSTYMHAPWKGRLIAHAPVLYVMPAVFSGCYHCICGHTLTIPHAPLLSLSSAQPPKSSPLLGWRTRGGVLPSVRVTCVSACMCACVCVSCVCLSVCVCVRASLF